MSTGRMARAGVLIALALVAVTACSRKDPNLMQIGRARYTPDEFAILPSKPIETPPSYTALPPPAPVGSPNRTDVTPTADAVAALGGNPARVAQDGKLGADGALIKQTSRYGTDPQIRTELAQDDLEYRQRHRGRLMERIFRVPTYYRVYEGSELNQYGSLIGARQRNVPTPAAPPDPVVQE
ncbi:DUF3035 domain-containing protein [Tropicimonas sp. IMCC34043]|uniref:DUF3035 domain-containing protein n=1 Tax=Tropicimonas sp. IMCC34043 TaxID=2248760 RepID=UPI001E546B99|nr:DUF3035 domain-containing protein [Tropicimonas sp. IMCC34043]